MECARYVFEGSLLEQLAWRNATTSSLTSVKTYSLGTSEGASSSRNPQASFARHITA